MGEGGHCPAELRIFKNKPSMDFESAENTKPDQVIQTVYVHEPIEYQLKPSVFFGVTSLQLYFPKSMGGQPSRLHYIGLRGTTSRQKRQVVNCVYESAPQAKDHLDKIHDEDEISKLTNNT